MARSDLLILTPQGRLDAAGAPHLQEELKRYIDSGRVQLLVDLGNTQYISSNGLRTLLVALRNAKERGGMLKLCCLSPRVLEIFQMIGFDRIFEIYATREQAEASFQEAGDAT